MKHNTNLQLLRGAACTLVFVMHFMLIERKVIGHEGLLGDWAWIGSIAVDLFFAISGFIMVTISRGRFGGRQAWFRFIFERAARIYPAYWAFSLVVLAIYIARPSMVNGSQGNQVDIVSSFLLLPQPLLPLLAVGWTLVYEIYFYLVFAAFVGWLPERLLGRALAAWALAVVVLDHLLAGQGAPWLRIVSSPMTLEFIAGACAGWITLRPSKVLGAAAFAAAAAWLAVALLLMPTGLQEVFAHPWPRVIVSAVPCALIVYGAVVVDGPARGLLRRAGAWVGDRSYSFYLCHLLVLSATARLWSLHPATGPVLTPAAFAASYLACLMVATASYRWLERPVMNNAKRWLARRAAHA